MKKKTPRFPFGIPNGWFPVAFSDELAPGEVRELHVFGEDLCLFRTEGGAARVLDGYCPHLGAHLPTGGDVVGETVRCPFHLWRFDGAGRCVEIPYTKKIPPKACVRAWPVDEKNGRIHVWRHSEGKPPFYEIPTIEAWGAPGWTTSFEKYVWRVKTHPQEIMENAIDWPHFQTVHLMDLPDHVGERFEGPMFHWTVETEKEVTTMEGVRDHFTIRAENWGIGFNWLTYTGMFTTVVTAGLTPLDDETTEISFGIIGKLDGRTEEETRAILKAYMDDQSNAIQQDFAIWEAKKFRERPVLSDGDGPIAPFRKWTRQFYSQPAV